MRAHLLCTVVYVNPRRGRNTKGRQVTRHDPLATSVPIAVSERALFQVPLHQEIGRLSIGLWRLCIYCQTPRLSDNRHGPVVNI
jgi:hypothetical protein